MISCDKTTCVYNEWNIIDQTFCKRDITVIKNGKCSDFTKRSNEEQLKKRAIYPYKKNGKHLY